MIFIYPLSGGSTSIIDDASDYAIEALLQNIMQVE
jgi:hypothetical protein